ncbi:MAG: TrmH family RNA methyltransferase [Planctomycetota bacterium]
MISSRQNPTFRDAVRLRNSAANRRKAGLILIDGAREIQLAHESGLHLEQIFAGPDIDVNALLPGLLPESHARLVELAAPLLEKLSYGQKSNDLVAIAATPQLGIERLPQAAVPLQLVLERPEKPGNVGACFRTAAAAGATSVILVDPVCEPFNPNAIRASRGTIFTVPMAVCDSEQFRRYIEQSPANLHAAVVDGEVSLWDCDFRDGSILAFGNESEGLTNELLQIPSTRFQIPMQGAADSLNLSISSAVSLYEAQRQRANHS